MSGAGKRMGRIPGRLFRSVAIACLVAAPGWAGEAERPLGDLTTITPEGGTVRVEGDRLDIYDRDSRRDGYGIRRADGSWDVFNREGSRRATITPGIGGQPARVTIPQGKR